MIKYYNFSMYCLFPISILTLAVLARYKLNIIKLGTPKFEGEANRSGSFSGPVRLTIKKSSLNL